MKKIILKIAIVLLFIINFGIVTTSCSGNSKKKTDITRKNVIKNYADIVYASYKDSYDEALKMKTAVYTFASAPTEATFKATKDAWKVAREPYGQTEVYRGSDGPIDTSAPTFTNGLDIEGQLNAWPLDEAYIDYVTPSSKTYAGENTGGLIAETSFDITKASIKGKNEDVNDESVSTGWHAIEFLLWGQDETLPSEAKPGQRPLTDYTTAALKYRRIKYLKTVTDLLIDDLKSLVDTWKEGGKYRTEFLALDESIALANIIRGSFFIAAKELSVERMSTAVESTGGFDGSGQEDEHSCFSDNTHRDIYSNSQGVVNVVFGKYKTVSGASFYELVKQKDATQAEKLKVAIDEMKTAINAIDAEAKGGKHFDQMIVDESSSDNPLGLVMAGVKSLKKVADEISASASKIDIKLN